MVSSHGENPAHHAADEGVGTIPPRRFINVRAAIILLGLSVLIGVGVIVTDRLSPRSRQPATLPVELPATLPAFTESKGNPR